MLLLKRHLIALVRAGKKRQTIRFWSRPRVRVGQLAYTPGLGRLRIDTVDTLPSLAALTAADARADGFPTRKALLAEITRIYGPAVAPGKTLYRIGFTWPPPETPPVVEPHRITRTKKPKPVSTAARKKQLADFLRTLPQEEVSHRGHRELS